VNSEGSQLRDIKLSNDEREEIKKHIAELLPEKPNEEWSPTEDMGGQMTLYIDLQRWENDDCVYFSDGLYPGGNNEAVIGVIDTIAVDDHIDCYQKLKSLSRARHNK
jgi:hypothetical protein